MLLRIPTSLNRLEDNKVISGSTPTLPTVSTWLVCWDGMDSKTTGVNWSQVEKPSPLFSLLLLVSPNYQPLLLTLHLSLVLKLLERWHSMSLIKFLESKPIKKTLWYWREMKWKVKLSLKTFASIIHQILIWKFSRTLTLRLKPDQQLDLLDLQDQVNRPLSNFLRDIMTQLVEW